MTAAPPADADAWARERLSERGLTLAGPPQVVHDRPWSSATRYPLAGHGPAPRACWLKVNGPGTAYEPALLELLDRRRPGLVPVVFATRGAWSLQEDGGPTLREAPVAQQWPRWAELLPRYGAAQLALAGSREDLLATGLPDRSPGALPALARGLVSELADLAPERGGLTASQVGGLEAELPTYDQACGALAASGIPATAQHDDLHAGNVCTSLRILDWGDASLGHPFGTLLATLNSLAAGAEVPPTDPRILEVCTAYLAAFAAFGTVERLLPLVDQARYAGIVARALAWRSALGDAVSAGAEWDSRCAAGC